MSARGIACDAPAWQAVQANRLGLHLRRVRQSAMYQRLGISLELEKELARGAAALPGVLAQLPLTTKAQLADAGPGAWVASPDQVAEWVCTSGTSGKPLDVPLTAGDLDRLAENEAAALEIAGVRAGDLFIVAVGMERLFVAGLAYWLGARRLGAACVRVGPQLGGQPGLLRDLVARMGSRPGTGRTFVIAVPSFLLTLGSADLAGREALQGIIAIGEPIRSAWQREGGDAGGAGAGAQESHGAAGAYNALGARLHETFHCPIMSTYATTETCTTFAEGPLCRGGHLNPALGIVECLDDSGAAVPEGHVGEIVVTPLGVEGLPLVRFRTGDMAALHTGVCACGRNTPRVGPIVGRRGQLLKFKGTSIYPGAIVETLRANPAVADCVVVATQAHALCDQLAVYIELRPEACDGSPGSGGGDAGVGGAVPRAAVCAQVESALRVLLRATPEIRYVSPKALKEMQVAAGSRKLPRFIDRRESPRT
jgi:phenylacetate-CoA ligase